MSTLGINYNKKLQIEKENEDCSSFLVFNNTSKNWKKLFQSVSYSIIILTFKKAQNKLQYLEQSNSYNTLKSFYQLYTAPSTTKPFLFNLLKLIVLIFKLIHLKAKQKYDSTHQMESIYNTYFDENGKKFNQKLLTKICSEFTVSQKTAFIKNFRENIVANNKEEQTELLKSKQEIENFLKTCVLNELKQYDYQPKPEILPHVKETLLRCMHYIYNNENISEQKSCAVCTIEFKQEEKLVMLSCEHYFHIECIQKWFESRINCPLCRNNLIQVSKSETMKQQEKELENIKYRLQQAQARANILIALSNGFIDQITL